jgi:F0F1-type ATP synthase assembly protein I
MSEQKVNWVQTLGAVFLGIALYRFFFSEGWIVWLILGFLFGGFDVLSRKLKSGDER